MFNNRLDINSNVEASEKVASMLSQAGGLEKIASDVLPDLIKEQRDYEGFARKLLKVHPVGRDEIVKNEKGEFFKQYPKDVDAGAAFYGEEVDAPQYKLEGTLINVPILTIVSDESTIDRKRILVERLDYLEMAKNKAGQAIAKLEDYKVLSLAEALIQGNGTAAAPEYVNQIVTVAGTTLAKADLVKLRKTQSQHDHKVGSFLLHPGTLDDMLGWEDNEVDETTRRELIESGVKYQIWGTAIITTRLVDTKIVYSFGEPEYLGVMPVLADIVSELIDTPNRLIKGLLLYEFVGFALVNHRCVGKLILGYSSGDKITSYAQVTTGAKANG